MHIAIHIFGTRRDKWVSLRGTELYRHTGIVIALHVGVQSLQFGDWLDLQTCVGGYCSPIVWQLA